MNFKLNPTQQIVLILELCALGAIATNWTSAGTNLLIHLAATVGFGLALFHIFQKISGKTKNIWNTLITCLIIFLVLNFDLQNKDLIFPLVATFVAIFSKFYLEPKGSPVINPVVLGLLAAWGIGKMIPGLNEPLISWWGASYKILLTGIGINYAVNFPLALTIIWILTGLSSWRKYPIFFSFLITFSAILLVFLRNPPELGSSLDTIKFIFTDGTIYFLAAVMLIEPRTSPMLKKDQIIYGILAGIIISLGPIFKLSNFELVAIAAANLCWFATKWTRMQKMQAAKAASNKPQPTIQV